MPGTYPTNSLAAPQNPNTLPSLTAPFRRPFWSTAINLGQRFGQLWPR